MAQTKTFKAARRGRPELYPYKVWFNMKSHELVPGKDFQVSPAAVRAAIYAAARVKGMVVKTSTIEKNGETHVTVQRLVGKAAQTYAAKNTRRVVKA